LPDGLSFVRKLAFLTERERKFMSQLQGRTYANLFGMTERFINAKVLELGQRHVLGAGGTRRSAPSAFDSSIASIRAA
jgi:hypothetical protein